MPPLLHSVSYSQSLTALDKTVEMYCWPNCRWWCNCNMTSKWSERHKWLAIWWMCEYIYVWQVLRLVDRPDRRNGLPIAFFGLQVTKNYWIFYSKKTIEGWNTTHVYERFRLNCQEFWPNPFYAIRMLCTRPTTKPIDWPKMPTPKNR